jgi:hypothetical protein
MYSQKKESRGAGSGGQGGKVICPPIPIHFPGNLHCKKYVTSLWKCGGVPSCWNIMSRYTMSVTLCSAKKKVWTQKKNLNTFCLHKAQDKFIFGLALVCSVTWWGQILRLCQLTFSNKWDVTSSQVTIFTVKVCHIQVLKEINGKICRKLLYLWSYMLQPLVPITYKI